MTEPLDFLSAICRDPTDDTPRLVYADFLEENGEQDRSAFIRCQIVLATCKLCNTKNGPRKGGWAESCARCNPLRRRERELRESRPNYNTWLAQLDKVIGEPTADMDYLGERQWAPRFWIRFRRGFVSEIRLPMAQWYRQCERCGGKGHTNALLQLHQFSESSEWEVWRCPDCHGTGNTGSGPAIVKAAPIALDGLRFSDPPGFEQGGWMPTDGHRYQIPLPREWCELLTDLPQTITDPITRLSHIAVNWAREKAGLPAFRGAEQAGLCLPCIRGKDGMLKKRNSRPAPSPR
jgi:uncharacterized protein (TIGR02996 family)